jgi:hypothetical protein
MRVQRRHQKRLGSGAIGYSGSNHITAMLEIRDSRKYRGDDYKKLVPIIVHYGTIPDDFWRRWKERQGSEVEIIRCNGRWDAPEAKEATAETPAGLYTKSKEIAIKFCDGSTEQERKRSQGRRDVGRRPVGSGRLGEDEAQDGTSPRSAPSSRKPRFDPLANGTYPRSKIRGSNRTVPIVQAPRKVHTAAYDARAGVPP